MATTTAADILVRNLQHWGVEIIFGIPGDGINGIIESLRKAKDRIRFIQVRHEEAAALFKAMCARPSNCCCLPPARSNGTSIRRADSP